MTLEENYTLPQLLDKEPADALEFVARIKQRAMNDVIDRGDSVIQKFYSDAIVLITGGSGFLGKSLLEKLFRSCNIKKVYMLTRSRKGNSMQERFETMLTDPIFDCLRQKQPRFADKIVLVEGDVSEIRLGISDQDWNTIAQTVDVIFHMAATTRFDESLRVATLINVRGIREVFALANDCKKLRSFVHVSTAYCAATRDRIGSTVAEQFYPSPVPPDALIRLAEGMDTARLDAITPQLIDGWPNTYAFTKAVAEEAVRTMSGKLPVCIVRPPIVIGSYSEPTPGWVDMSCVFGASGIILGIIIGGLRVLLCKNNNRMCYMPADYVTNMTIAAGWDTVARRHKGEEETRIYTISNTRWGVTFSYVNKVLRTKEVKRWSTPKVVWYCFMLETENKMLYWILFWLLHYIPAYVVDGICFLFRVKRPPGIPPLVKIYTKVQRLTTLLSYFSTNDWDFQDDNVVNMYNKMSAEDKAIYNFDVTKISWPEMMLVWSLGVRKFIIKDGLKDSLYGYKKQKWLRVANYIVVIIFFYLLYKILCMFYFTLKYVFYVY